jgi:hypothetical protein
VCVCACVCACRRWLRSGGARGRAGGGGLATGGSAGVVRAAASPPSFLPGTSAFVCGCPRACVAVCVCACVYVAGRGGRQRRRVGRRFNEDDDEGSDIIVNHSGWSRPFSADHAEMAWSEQTQRDAARARHNRTYVRRTLSSIRQVDAQTHCSARRGLPGRLGFGWRGRGRW